jgi:hypothetical protein
MIHFNVLGAVMLLGSALVGFAFGAFGVSPRIYGTIALLLMCTLDILYRWRNKAEGREKWLGQRTGGFLGIAPVWITALVLAVLLYAGLLES